MTLNKFCPVAQGEYYNNKSPRKSQHFFPVFSKFFLLSFCLSYICPSSKFIIKVLLFFDSPKRSMRFLFVYSSELITFAFH